MISGRTIAAAIALCLLLVGCSRHGLTRDPDSSGPVVTSTLRGLPRPQHTVVVVFENKGASDVIDNASAPYLTRLARSGAVFTHAHGIAHPSQPNYVALFAGSTHGVTDDSCPQDLGAQPNLAQQLVAAHLTFAGYAEGLPHAGFTGCSADDGRYRRKHVPWADFSNVPARSSRPLSSMPKDFSKLPTVSFVIPDMCHDMHDCSVATGDSWARGHLSAYARWAWTHHSLLVVTFDEDDGTSSNHIPLFLVGAGVRPGKLGQDVDHYNVLRTIEEMYGLHPLGLAARTQPLAGWFS